MSQTKSRNGVVRGVTSRNTIRHWVLYTLDGLESDNQEESANPAREQGVYPETIYEYAAGDDSIVFTGKREIQSALSDMARDGASWEAESRPVNRRTDETDWDGVDVEFRYRLNEWGREVLLDLGVPEKLPNRRDFDEQDRALGVKPAHEPGWWMDEYELFDSEWDIRNNDWVAGSVDRLFYKDEADAAFATERGYDQIGEKLADLFPDVTFVLTSGPWREHDIMYAIRDPWRKVVQIDVYSPMQMHRSTDQIRESVQALVDDLAKGLESVTDE